MRPCKAFSSQGRMKKPDGEAAGVDEDPEETGGEIQCCMHCNVNDRKHSVLYPIMAQSQ